MVTDCGFTRDNNWSIEAIRAMMKESIAYAMCTLLLKENQTADYSTVWLVDWSYSFVWTRASAVDSKTAISR